MLRGLALRGAPGELIISYNSDMQRPAFVQYPKGRCMSHPCRYHTVESLSEPRACLRSSCRVLYAAPGRIYALSGRPAIMYDPSASCLPRPTVITHSPGAACCAGRYYSKPTGAACRALAATMLLGHLPGAACRAPLYMHFSVAACCARRLHGNPLGAARRARTVDMLQDHLPGAPCRARAVIYAHSGRVMQRPHR